LPSPQQDLFALVVPDLPALRKQFSYSVPERFTDRVRVGSQVRVDVQGRRVAGWVVELADRPPPGVAVRPITAVRGIGPPQSVVEIANWASWRWAGALAFGLRTASSEKVVANLPPVARLGSRPPEHDSTVQGLATGEIESLVNADGGPAIVRIGPSGDRLGALRVAADLLWKENGNDQADPAGVLVLAPTHAQANEAAERLKRSGYPVALLPDEWAVARAGRCVVVGTMSAAFAPLGRLAAAVVLDAHDEAYHAEAAPTWCAWEVVQERAKRDGAPLVLVSPCPTLDVLRAGRLVVTDRISERRAWPLVEAVDRRQDDPHTGLFSERVVRLVRWAAEPSDDASGDRQRQRRVICVLNRTGRARLLSCAACKTLAHCERCGGALGSSDAGLTCGRCGLERPLVCSQCGSTRLLALRVGVGRVREELEALAGTPVVEVSGKPVRRRNGAPGSIDPDARVVVGTEAALHRVNRADAVIFLEFDSELMAPRLRAAEEALGLLARAARLVSRSSRYSDAPPGAPLIVQTRMPDHPAIASAVHADPSLLAREELEIRTTLGLPPFSALARLSGPAADSYGSALRESAPPSVEVSGPHEQQWRIVAPDHQTLCDLLSSVPRPNGRLRVEVDPVRA
jgi:primosomal protein N' (replication factor Y)